MKMPAALLLFFTGPAYAGTAFNCDYAFLGMPTTGVKAFANDDGTLASSVEITVQDQMHKETATAEPLAAGEKLHLWISKESRENSIEMIVYSDTKSEGNSKLVNHHVPFGQEMWGTCSAEEN